MKTKVLKELAVNTLEDMKGQDVVCLDIGKISSFADYMVVVTGTSNRHVKSLAAELKQAAKKADLPVPGVEGEDQGDWVLVDMGDVLIHVMLADTRALYDLESLWSMGNSKPAKA